MRRQIKRDAPLPRALSITWTYQVSAKVRTIPMQPLDFWILQDFRNGKRSRRIRQLRKARAVKVIPQETVIQTAIRIVQQIQIQIPIQIPIQRIPTPIQQMEPEQMGVLTRMLQEITVRRAEPQRFRVERPAAETARTLSVQP